MPISRLQNGAVPADCNQMVDEFFVLRPIELQDAFGLNLMVIVLLQEDLRFWRILAHLKSHNLLNHAFDVIMTLLVSYFTDN